MKTIDVMISTWYISSCQLVITTKSLATTYAGVAELADAHDSKSCSSGVPVRPRPPVSFKSIVAVSSGS